MRVFEALARLGLALPTPSSLSSNWPLFASLSHYVCTLGCIVGYSVALTALLYLGTLYADFRGKVLPGQRHFRKDNGLQCIRNYVVAPISEELVFRASMLATIQYAEPPVSLACKIFATPLYFGLAHVHHAWEMFALHGKTRHAMHSALLSSALQFAYTIVFGWYADALFLRTGSVLAPCAAHIVCNAMGLPRVARDAKTTSIVLSVVGLAAFAYAFGPLTSVALFGGYMD
ncbi:CAAX prenyl protease [Malassezia vespertilionis]|uniref:intramembrane prenyl-peptidase Rce1 n=1 Tax=Malassezia vespertilionis TaxID=2020962 RepID=A0A2N1J7B5_9BASI|nr:CAAX prenyl protease [Malassezia vespertilionis]PKI82439.1 hypothetical protein MVES_003626 [Malassezia vespertilionis]WFD08016.1 CAAX prenyl protease [Malassezia vespertilionis]